MSINSNLAKWIEFDENFTGLKSVLIEMEQILEQDAEDLIDHHSVDPTITRYEVSIAFLKSISFCIVGVRI